MNDKEWKQSTNHKCNESIYGPLTVINPYWMYERF